METVLSSVPHKKLSEEEINSILSEPTRMREDDPIIDPALTMGGPLYQALWTLTCAAIVLAREYLESQPNSKELLKIFHSRNVTKYVGKTLGAFGLELDEIENLTPEARFNVMQVFFEKVIIAVNEEIYFSQGGKYPRQ
jgi:hypothetical protein